MNFELYCFIKGYYDFIMVSLAYQAVCECSPHSLAVSFLGSFRG